jgi:hypothetical protein
MNILQASRSKSWPAVTGTIIDSAPAKSEKPDGSSIYVANIIYSYEVDRIGFISESISCFGYDLLNPSDAYYTGSINEITSLLDKYPVGDNVKVYYNPEDPEESVIKTDLKLPVVIPLLSGLFIIAVFLHMHFFLNYLGKKGTG